MPLTVYQNEQINILYVYIYVQKKTATREETIEILFSDN